MPTLPSLDQGWGRGIRHTYDPAPVRLPSRQTPAHPPNASATAQAHDRKASEPPQHPLHARPPNGRQSSCQTPAHPPNASATAQAHDRKASEPPQHPPHASPPNGRQSSCQTPALPPSACLPAERQPTRQTPALPPSACLPAERQPTRQTPALQRKHTTGRQANQSGEGPGREPSQEFIRTTSGSPRGGEGEGQDGPRPGPFQEAPRDRHGPA